MIRKNYRSDFCLILDLYDAAGKKMDLPDYNFTVRVTTAGNCCFTAYRRGDITKGFVIRDGKIVLVCDNHGLLPGVVKVTFEGDIPNNIYPDGYEHIFRRIETDIQLTDRESDDDLAAMVSLALPLLSNAPPPILSEATDKEILELSQNIFNR